MQYRLKPGHKHGTMKPGEVCELSPTQALAFADKFEPAEKEPVRAIAPEPVDVPAIEPETEPEAAQVAEMAEAPANTESPAKKHKRRR